MKCTNRAAFPAAVLLLALSAALFAACGGDSSKDTGSGGGSGSAQATGSDQEFMKGLCLAGQHFIDKMLKGFSTPANSSTAASMDDLGNAFASFFLNLAPAFEGLDNEFRALKPPKDLAQWHADAVVKMDAAVKALKAGNVDDPALQGMGNDAIPPLPQAAQDRLQKDSADIKECKDLDKMNNSDGTSSSIFGGLTSGSGSDASATATPKK
jgi:hypothetical protein